MFKIKILIYVYIYILVEIVDTLIVFHKFCLLEIFYYHYIDIIYITN